VAATQTRLSASILQRNSKGKDRASYVVRVENTGKTPAFQTALEITGRRHSFFASDNFFWLAPGESREIEMQVLWRESGGQPGVRVTAWNADAVALR
jgi:beta-mannosidase